MSLITINLGEPVQVQRIAPLFLVDALDAITPETGLTGAAYLQIGTAAWVTSVNPIVEPVNPAGIVTGGYTLELAVSEVSALGQIKIYYKASATAVFMGAVQVVEVATQADLSALSSKLTIIEQKLDEVLLNLSGIVEDSADLAELSTV